MVEVLSFIDIKNYATITYEIWYNSFSIQNLVAKIWILDNLAEVVGSIKPLPLLYLVVIVDWNKKNCKTTKSNKDQVTQEHNTGGYI